MATAKIPVTAAVASAGWPFMDAKQALTHKARLAQLEGLTVARAS
jgi:hypothetical protein